MVLLNPRQSPATMMLERVLTNQMDVQGGRLESGAE